MPGATVCRVKLLQANEGNSPASAECQKRDLVFNWPCRWHQLSNRKQSAEDVQLVQQCLSGDELSMRAFLSKYQGLVFSLCLRMLGHREDAEDVAQDSLVRVFRNLEKWDQQRPIKPWLLTIAANRCRTALAKKSKLP